MCHCIGHIYVLRLLRIKLAGRMDLVHLLCVLGSGTRKPFSRRPNLHLQVGPTIVLLGFRRHLDLRVDAHHRIGPLRLHRLAGIGRSQGSDDHQLCCLHSFRIG
jgi:hypothetical protein